MRMLIYGICMHIERDGKPHLIAVPAGKGYQVDDENGRPIVVPNHTASLTVRYNDINADDRDAAIRQFEDGGGLASLPATEDERSWELDQVTLYCNVAGPFSFGDVRNCVPSLTATMPQLKLLPKVENAETTEEVAAYMIVSGGTFSARVEETARHTMLTGGDGAWTLTIRYRDDTRVRTLPLNGSAEVTLMNHEASACNPCSDNDYLLHYRLTATNFLPSSYFMAPLCIPTPNFNPRQFPLPDGDITSTLLSCSNSNYP